MKRRSDKYRMRHTLLQREMAKFRKTGEPSKWLLRYALRPKNEAVLKQMYPHLLWGEPEPTLEERLNGVVNSYYNKAIVEQFNKQAIFYKWYVGLK